MADLAAAAAVRWRQEIKLLFTEGPAVTTRFVLLVLTSILLMTLDHKQQHLQNLRAALSVVVYPLQVVADLPFESGKWLAESLSSRQRLQEENASLHSQNLLLQVQLQRLSALEIENQRLRELLGSSFKLPHRVLIAELFRVAMDPYRHLIEINKGAYDDAYVDQPVLDAHGVMGQIIRVEPFTSTARLITDPGHMLQVQVNRNGLRTLAVGTGVTNRLSLPYLPNNADIRPGDLLITSGLGGVYPMGYPVARVVEVKVDPSEPFARVTAEPVAHLDRSREVLLVWTRGQAVLDLSPGGQRGNGPAAGDTP